MDLTTYADPLPQALVLTAIVISFGMTAVVVMIGLGAFLGSNDDHVDDQPDARKNGRRAIMTHWIIAPVILPALLAPLHRAGARYHIGIQRAFSVAGVLALIAIAPGWPGRRPTEP